MNSDLRKEINRVGNLKQNKGKDDLEIAHIAQINLKVREFKNTPLFPNNEDQELAEKKFKSYLNDYEFESLSDIDSLRSLLFTEILETKLQKQITTKLAKEETLSEYATRQLKDVQNQIASLKIKLGIDKEDNKEDELTGLETLKERYEKYIQQNKNEFTIVCKHCAKPLLLRRRVEDFEAYKHPWFAGRWLFNYEILKDVKDGKLEKETAWKYMCAASKGINHQPKKDGKYCTDYIDYCLKNWDDIVSHIDN